MQRLLAARILKCSLLATECNFGALLHHCDEPFNAPIVIFVIIYSSPAGDTVSSTRGEKRNLSPWL